MFKTYHIISHEYPKISLDEERRLIAQAQRRCNGKANEIVMRHISFVRFRINKKIFPAYRDRFAEDILSQATFILYDKIESYDLKYKDKSGNPKPVRFTSYIWKRIDGFITDYLNKELRKERQERGLDYIDFDHGGLCKQQLQ